MLNLLGSSGTGVREMWRQEPQRGFATRHMRRLLDGEFRASSEMRALMAEGPQDLRAVASDRLGVVRRCFVRKSHCRHGWDSHLDRRGTWHGKAR